MQGAPVHFNDALWRPTPADWVKSSCWLMMVLTTPSRFTTSHCVIKMHILGWLSLLWTSQHSCVCCFMDGLSWSRLNSHLHGFRCLCPEYEGNEPFLLLSRENKESKNEAVAWIFLLREHAPTHTKNLYRWKDSITRYNEANLCGSCYTHTSPQRWKTQN